LNAQFARRVLSFVTTGESANGAILMHLTFSCYGLIPSEEDGNVCNNHTRRRVRLTAAWGRQCRLDEQRGFGAC
jgi:hypothetical protein